MSYDAHDFIDTITDALGVTDGDTESEQADGCLEAIEKLKARAKAKRPLNRRELGTVLAALRLYQRSGETRRADVADIASDGGIRPLDMTEIDALCERLNVRPKKTRQPAKEADPSIEELREHCRCDLPAGPIWQPSVVASNDTGSWKWHDTRDDCPTYHGPFPTERAALLDAIAKEGGAR